MKTNLNYTIKIVDKNTSKEVEFTVLDFNTMRMLHPKNGNEILEISMDAKGIPKITPLNDYRTPEDAGKCLLYCAEGCNGSLLCVAGCAAECATIII